MDEVIEKMVKGPVLLNIIINAHEDKTKSKRWALCLNSIWTGGVGRKIQPFSEICCYS